MKHPIGREIIVDIEPVILGTHNGKRNQKKMVLDEKNKGFLKMRLDGPSVIKLMNAFQDSSVSYIGIPGADMFIHLDSRGEDTTHYNDIGPGETDFYHDILDKTRGKLKAISQQDPSQFLNAWRQEFNAVQKLIATYAPGMSTGYVTWIRQSMQSLFQSELCRQFVAYTTITRRWPVNLEEYKSIVSPFTVSQFEQPGFFTRETDKELAETYYLFYSLIEDKKKQLPAPDVETTYRNAIKYAGKITAEGPRNIMVRYLVTSLTSHTTDTGVLKWMKNTIAFGKQNDHLKKMIGEKQNLLRRIGKNKLAPYFEGTDISGNKFSYKNYEGKYLFLDIWATWCVPCRKEIPYLEKLKQKYAGQPIEFISVSTDNNVNAWKKFIESTESKDQFHSIPDNAFSIREAYNAVLIPAFVLIDPQGKIINPASYRPSDPALDLLLNELLFGKNDAKTIQ